MLFRSVRVDTERLGSPESVLHQLKSLDCPVEKKGRLLIPRHNAVTEFYGVKSHRSYPVSERLLAETIQVQAFAIYDEQAIDQVLAQFHAVSKA